MNKRRTTTLILLLLVVLLLLTGCSKGEPFTCYWCGEEKTGKRHKGMDGSDDLYFCDDCYKEIKELGEDLGLDE